MKTKPSIQISEVILEALEDKTPIVILVFMGYFIYGHSVTTLAKMFDVRVREIQKWVKTLREDIQDELIRAGGQLEDAGRLVNVDDEHPREPTRVKRKDPDDNYQDLDTFIEESFYE